MRIMTTTRIVEIQIGDSTHHQDQSITSTNFRTMKTMVSNPTNPIPPPEEEELVCLVIIYLLSIVLMASFSTG
jgi:hypothetical protein